MKFCKIAALVNLTSHVLLHGAILVSIENRVACKTTFCTWKSHGRLRWSHLWRAQQSLSVQRPGRRMTLTRLSQHTPKTGKKWGTPATSETQDSTLVIFIYPGPAWVCKH